MEHIERGFCTRIDTTVLDELREEKLEFPKRLEKLTQEAVRGNYTKYLPSARGEVRVPGWYVEKEPSSFEVAQEEFPALPATHGGLTQPGDGHPDEKGKGRLVQLPLRSAIQADGSTAQSNEAEAQPSTLSFRFLNHGHRDGKQDVAKEMRLLLPSLKPGVTTVFGNMNLDDPDSPYFSAASHYCAISERFNCPKRMCR